MTTAESVTPGTAILTADGIPLKDSLQISLRRSKRRAMLLVAGPLLFLLFLFIIPIGDMLLRSIDDTLVNRVMPNTLAAFESWDKKSEPTEEMYAAVALDLKNAERTDMGKVSTRMNYAKPGWKSLIKITSRKLKKIEGPPYKEALIKAEKRWADKEFWLSLGIMKDKYSFGYFLNAVDKTYDFDKNIIDIAEERKVYNLLWYRTLLVSFMVTIACL